MKTAGFNIGVVRTTRRSQAAASFFPNRNGDKPVITTFSSRTPAPLSHYDNVIGGFWNEWVSRAWLFLHSQSCNARPVCVFGVGLSLACWILFLLSEQEQASAKHPCCLPEAGEQYYTTFPRSAPTAKYCYPASWFHTS